MYLPFAAKFELRSFTRSWDNREYRAYSKNLRSPWIGLRPRTLPFLPYFKGLRFGWAPRSAADPTAWGCLTTLPQAPSRRGHSDSLVHAYYIGTPLPIPSSTPSATQSRHLGYQAPQHKFLATSMLSSAQNVYRVYIYYIIPIAARNSVSSWPMANDRSTSESLIKS